MLRGDALTVVCFGDSITGYRPGIMYRHQYLKWSDLLELMIEARTGQSSVRVLNRGFAGDKTYPDPAAGTPGAIHRFQADVTRRCENARLTRPACTPDAPCRLLRRAFSGRQA